MNALQMLQQQPTTHGRGDLSNVMSKVKTDSSSMPEIFQLLFEKVHSAPRGQLVMEPNGSEVSDANFSGSSNMLLEQLALLNPIAISESTQESAQEEMLSDGQLELLTSLMGKEGLKPDTTPLAQIDVNTLNTITAEALSLIKGLLDTFKKQSASTGPSHKDGAIANISGKLFKLLQAYSQVDQKLIPNTSAINDQSSLQHKGSQQEAVIWQNLINTYTKRAQFVARQHYNADAAISSQDIGKWIQSALKQSSDLIDNEGSAAIKSQVQTMPLSRIEQYVIYTNQQTEGSGPDKQVMEQFQKAIQSSRFMMQNEGGIKLHFTLRPDNLGDMTVKLQQINGEMTVKILVSSSAAKDMMEKNIHQLKHMFSPHQVVIERQDVQVSQNQGLYSDQDEYQEEGHTHDEQSHQKDNNEDETRDEESFQDQLNYVLNEKV